jgi:hypothetical protein
MIKLYSILCLMFCMVNFCYSQIDEIFLITDSQETDSTGSDLMLSPGKIKEYIQSQSHRQNEWIVGGYISSIFHESIDSAKIIIKVDNKKTDSVYSHNGLYSLISGIKGSILDVHISHPDYHPFDTSLLINNSKIMIVSCSLEPKYKISLRGRVFAGNMPMEGVNVKIKHENETFMLKTRGCYYDKENYWNCLYAGMFKVDITTDNPDDSVQIYLTQEGMKPVYYGMVINEYRGEIMELKMRYEPSLPDVPLNCINLKLAFPFISTQSDWFVSLSYYRLINGTKLRRLAYGAEGNLYVSNISVRHNTFPGLKQAIADSSYLDGFIGPSVLFWIICPEKRYFSSYTGLTCAFHMGNPEITFEPFIGTRIFLDMNKALSLELRYSEFHTDIIHYTFNPFGNAQHYTLTEKLDKLHACLGIQIAF